jgi:hypothetical protein
MPAPGNGIPAAIFKQLKQGRTPLYETQRSKNPRTINGYEGACARFKAPEMIPAVAWTTGITRS